MLYSCTHMATVGIKGLTGNLCSHNSFYLGQVSLYSRSGENTDLSTLEGLMAAAAELVSTLIAGEVHAAALGQ